MSYIASIQEIIDKRLASLEYLRKVHGGTICWLNTVHISKKDFENLYLDDHKQQPPLNALHYFCLGGSLPAIMNHTHSLPDYLRTFHNLLKEYETLIGTTESSSKNKIAGVGRRLFRSRLKSADHAEYINTGNNGKTTSSSSSKGRPLSASAVSGSQGGGITPASPLFFSHHNHDFRHLTLYQLPFVPDVYETFLSLCEILIECYRQIHTLIQQEGHPSMQVQQESYELLVKIDDKIKKQFISPTVKDIDSLSRSLLYEETTKLDSLLIQAK